MLENPDEKTVKTYCSETGKRCYSRKEAGDSIRLAKRFGSHTKKIPMRVYRCEYCGAFHTTSKKNFTKKKVRGFGNDKGRNKV